MTDKFSGSAIFNAFSATYQTALTESIGRGTFVGVSLMGSTGTSMIGGAYGSPWTYSVTTLNGGRYDIDGQATSAQAVAIVVATLVKELKDKGIIR